MINLNMGILSIMLSTGGRKNSQRIWPNWIKPGGSDFLGDSRSGYTDALTSDYLIEW